jgi:pre-mRNA-processing factor 19
VSDIFPVFGVEKSVCGGACFGWVRLLLLHHHHHSSYPSMSWTCEISGEALGGTNDEIVVTPSGHICNKRLLLTKLAENGGIDPFETIKELPLSEDQLITLAASAATTTTSTTSLLSQAAPPRPQQASSIPNLLQLLQREYDSIVLELFDTRRVLEDTRRELSQALYQNDAAVRVVARLAQERDVAKNVLERWNASVVGTTPALAAVPGVNGGGGPSGSTIRGGGITSAETSVGITTNVEVDTVAGVTGTTMLVGRPGKDGDDDNVEPETKKRRLDPLAEPLKNDLPAVDWKTLQDTWVASTTGRKAQLKAAAARAPTSESLAKYSSLEQKAWHKATNKGILCMARTTTVDGKGMIVTAGKDKQLIVYDESNHVVQHKFVFGTMATSVDIRGRLVVAGDAKGKVAAFSLKEEDSSDSSLGDFNFGSAIVNVTVHPSQQHILVATANGRIVVIACSEETRTLQQVAVFQQDGDVDDVFTCACLHPDGLIYAVGTKGGQIQVWDFKNKILAAALQVGRKCLFDEIPCNIIPPFTFSQ